MVSLSRLLVLLGGLKVAASPAYALADAQAPETVHLGYATYQGTFNATSNITNFLGVRFAAPPVGMSQGLHRNGVLTALTSYRRTFRLHPLTDPGKLRFQAPRPPLVQPGVQLANVQPAGCPQAGEGTLAGNPFPSLVKRQQPNQNPPTEIEDCLLLK